MSHAVGWEVGPSNAKLAALRWAVGTRALDLGCGRGWYAAALADRGFRVVGMDQTNQVADPRIEVLVGEICPPLLFGDGAFDTVLLFGREYTLDGLPAVLERLGFRTLYCALEGRTHLPLVFAEFVRGPRAVKTLVRSALVALLKVGALHNPRVAGDIHWIGEKREAGS